MKPDLFLITYFISAANNVNDLNSRILSKTDRAPKQGKSVQIFFVWVMVDKMVADSDKIPLQMTNVFSFFHLQITIFDTFVRREIRESLPAIEIECTSHLERIVQFSWKMWENPKKINR